MQHNKIAQVKGLVAQRGGWPAIFCQFNGLNEALTKGTSQQPCPLSGDGKTKFRFFRDFKDSGGAYHNDVGAMPDGIELLSWYLNKSKAEVLDEIVSICGGKAVLHQAKPIQKKQSDNSLSQKEAERRQASIKRVWEGSQPIVGTLAEVYLRSRGIKSDLSHLGNNLRFHPKLSYKASQDAPWEHFPGLLAVYRDSKGKPLTLHRTFLKPDGSGKADVSNPKMVMAPPRDMRGGYILLDQPIDAPFGKYIGIAEGIENALSVREGAGVAMWVGYSDRLMEMVEYPSDVRSLLVYADVEPSGAGMRAAEAIKAKHKDKDVLIMKPNSTKTKVDWNDVYMEHGPDAFDFAMKPEYQVQGIDAIPVVGE